MPNAESLLAMAVEQGKGVLRLAPNWVPRSFCVPGRRIKLHPDDYYSFGANRGGIDERWFASTTKADNGPLTTPDEGLSYIVFEDGSKVERVLLKEAVAMAGREIIGPRLMDQYGMWPVYSKFFDNKGALPHHLHHRPADAARVGQLAKPEAYYFPPQLNNWLNDFPYTFFGLEPGTTREQVRQCLADWNKGDNHITDLSRAYRLWPGQAWDVPPGVLHAPGSLCTYEPQKASDVLSMFQSLVGDQPISWDLVVKDVPEDKKHDLDYLVSLIDWDLNADPEFYRHRFMPPKPARPIEEMKAEGYVENWIAYRSPDFSAKELTVLPGRTVTIKDAAAYGFILVQGHGRFGVWDVDSPALIRFGQLTSDEFFVTEKASREGIRVTNGSLTDPLVMLKHFGPGNPDLAA
mgnify:CR=1 FL=1